MRCEECGGFVVLDPRGHYVCVNCGKVVEQVFDSVIYSPSAVQVAGYEKPDRRIQLLDNVVTGKFRASYAWRVLGKLSADLGLSYERRLRIVEEFERVVTLSTRRGILIEKKLALLGLLVYLDIRRTNPYVSLKEITRIMRSRGFKIHFGDLIRMIPVARQLGLLRDGWDREVEDILERVGQIAPYELVEKDVKLILDRIRKYTAGHNRRNIAAAVTVVVLRHLGVSINLYVLAKKLRVPYSSLRANISFVESLLLEANLERFLN
ncbi:MAG: TFIIB-type zinc ribbon-containing protein [Infirmifilum sp.]